MSWICCKPFESLFRQLLSTIPFDTDQYTNIYTNIYLLQSPRYYERCPELSVKRPDSVIRTGAQGDKKPFLERAKRKFQSLYHFKKWYTVSETVTTSIAIDLQTVFRFCDLPVEIKLMVLGYVIRPGIIFLEPFTQRRDSAFLEIASLYHDQLPRGTHNLENLHLETPPKPFPKLGGSPIVRQPGFGLMATERLLYEEGHPIFYGENVFHLASGPLATTSEYFDNLEHKHRDMISKLALKMTIADLTREVFQHVKRKAQDRTFIPLIDLSCTMLKDIQVGIWVETCMETLEALWEQRFQWLQTFPRLRFLILSGMDRSLVLSYREPRLERPSVQEKENDIEFRIFMEICRMLARRTLTDEFGVRGRWTSPTRISSDRFDHAVWVMDVEGIEDWLAGLGPGVRYKS